MVSISDDSELVLDMSHLHGRVHLPCDWQELSKAHEDLVFRLSRCVILP